MSVGFDRLSTSVALSPTQTEKSTSPLDDKIASVASKALADEENVTLATVIKSSHKYDIVTHFGIGASLTRDIGTKIFFTKTLFFFIP